MEIFCVIFNGLDPFTILSYIKAISNTSYLLPSKKDINVWGLGTTPNRICSCGIGNSYKWVENTFKVFLGTSYRPETNLDVIFFCLWTYFMNGWRLICEKLHCCKGWYFLPLYLLYEDITVALGFMTKFKSLRLHV